VAAAKSIKSVTAVWGQIESAGFEEVRLIRQQVGMSTQFPIPSSDQMLLEKAVRIAKEFAQQYERDDIVGIVFLGAIVRGYFDPSADIDIAIFTKQGSEKLLANKFFKVDELEVHCWVSDYESELNTPWDMAKRWTYSQGQIHYDPQGQISKLLEAKVPLQPDEKKWLLMSGLALSEWYINRLTHLWVERGNLTSAHHMITQGLTHFFDMLFVLNNELIADTKWRYYCVERLAQLPSNFQERIQEIMRIQAFSVAELERRQQAFMEIWREMAPIVEQEVHMSYDEINQLV
jgi:predicted nucleotidyltransferase